MNDIYVPKPDRFYQYFASYDLEAMMKHVSYAQGKQLRWVSKHVPFCVGVCSNIPRFRSGSVCINDDMDELVGKMILFLNEISAKSKMLCEKKWAGAFYQLSCKEEEWNGLLHKCEESIVEEHGSNQPDLVVLDDVYDSCVVYKRSDIIDFKIFDKARKLSIIKSCKHAVEGIKRARTMFEQYVSRLPVLGFCSSNYDTVLISKKLAMKMELKLIHICAWKMTIYDF